MVKDSLILIDKVKSWFITAFIFLIFASGTPELFSFESDSTQLEPVDLRRPDNKLAPFKYFSGDSVKKSLDLNDGNLKPGAMDNIPYNPIQDSAYARALRLHIPPSVRINDDFRKFIKKRQIERELEKGLPWQIALENLKISPDILAPLPQDIVHRQEMINRSLYVPFMPNRIGAGVSVGLRDIGVFLGVVEDISPEITFELKYTEEIEIVIYSIQATVIATIYKGIRPAGKHKFVWNLRDDKGRPMPQGDYIGEVRIGNSRFIRKRIQIP